MRNHSRTHELARAAIIGLNLKRALDDLNSGALRRHGDAEGRPFHNRREIRRGNGEVRRHQMLDLVDDVSSILEHLQQRIFWGRLGNTQLRRWRNDEVILTAHQH